MPDITESTCKNCRKPIRRSRQTNTGHGGLESTRLGPWMHPAEDSEASDAIPCPGYVAEPTRTYDSRTGTLAVAERADARETSRG